MKKLNIKAVYPKKCLFLNTKEYEKYPYLLKNIAPRVCKPRMADGYYLFKAFKRIRIFIDFNRRLFQKGFVIRTVEHIGRKILHKYRKKAIAS